MKRPIQVLAVLLTFFFLIGSEGSKTSCDPNPNVVINGALNYTVDHEGDYKILGRVQNLGSITASYIRIAFDLFDAAGNLISEEWTYADGPTCMQTPAGYITSVLRQSDQGYFVVYTEIPATQVASVSAPRITWRSYALTQPQSNLTVTSWSPAIGPTGDLLMLGQTQNTGTNFLTDGTLWIYIMDAVGLVIDFGVSIINGDSYTENGTVKTDGLGPGNTAAFEKNMFLAATLYGSGVVLPDWDEIQTGTTQPGPNPEPDPPKPIPPAGDRSSYLPQKDRAEWQKELIIWRRGRVDQILEIESE